MPYFFAALIADKGDLWGRLQEIWWIVRDDLMHVHFEGKEEALSQAYRKSLDPDDMRFDSLGVARYRETDDRENLLYFHERGLEALACTEVAIAQRRLDADFLTSWSELMACHGFVAAAMMARGDDLQSRRAGVAGGRAVDVTQQRQWFSHYFLDHYQRRSTRRPTEDAIENLVNRVLAGEFGSQSDDVVRFFDRMLAEPDAPGEGTYRQLVGTYRDTELSIRKMRELVLLPTDGIPLLDPKLPLP